MPKQISKRERDRQRQKQFEQKRRELAKNPIQLQTGAGQSDVRNWPVVRAYVPVEEVFRATGFGSAGIVRRQPNGKLRYSFVMIGLLDGGIKSMFGKEDTTEQEIEDLLQKLGTDIPSFQTGSAELAARYIWGAHALAMNSGFIADAAWMRYLSVVPQLPGSPNWWLQQFTGPDGLADQGLVEFLERNPVPDGIPEDKEVMIWTTATFACSNPDAIRAHLSRKTPEFISDGEDDERADCFTWTRAYPKNHWSPLSKLGGRQTLGSVRVFSDHIIADSKVLSSASILIAKLKTAFGDGIRLTSTQWKSSDDLVRERDSGKNAND